MLDSSTPVGTNAAEDAAATGNSTARATAGGLASTEREGVVSTTRDNTAPLGLRERKKQQTRQRIMNIALELCDKQGFDATTVEQIANAADVSPRTVNRYFETKEDIVLAPVLDFGQMVADKLREEPRGGNELRALCNAYLQVIDDAATENSAVSFCRFQQMQRIARDSPSVNSRALEFADSKSAAITAVLAERLGTTQDALSVRLIVSTWQMLCHLAMDVHSELIMDCDPQIAVRAARATLLDAYAEFMRVCTEPPTESAE
ncbi:TetR family transcriptional regulator [Nocardia sp. NPDC004654]|uniref:TetR/AcrR family transcriptional regulator n=1 Tax=Nocardia sp. NPDC004654 TaxID=3154776 RepID=UPI0033B02E05